MLVIDRAGRHVSTGVVVPEGTQLDVLPLYSSEVQPAERLWTRVDEPAINRAFGSIAELEAVLAPRCVDLTELPELVRSHTLLLVAEDRWAMNITDQRDLV